MNTAPSSGRLVIIGDCERIGPIVQACFAPQPVVALRSYLTGIAEVPRAATRAVIVGRDPACRNPESAIRAIKTVSGAAPVVYCCEPAFEALARRLTACGADDYVIFPPDAEDLERALGLPARRTRQRLLETPAVVPVPNAEELARLADVLPRLGVRDADTLSDLAALICCAVDAHSATILLDGRIGRSARDGGSAGGRAAADEIADATLFEPIHRGAQVVGQIRVGRSRRGGFGHEDTLKLRHYGVLFGRLLEAADKSDHWRRQAYTDDLTGLGNRRRLDEFLGARLAAAERSRSTVTLLMFDIDDFKHYNDQYGHDAGDQILCDVAKLLMQCSRDTDLTVRYGGDEFMVVFWDAEAPRSPGSHHPNEVLAVVNRFRQALKKHTFSRLGPDATGRLTISGGLAQFPWQARTAAELIAAADKALLQAKAAGKNRFWLIGSGDVAG